MDILRSNPPAYKGTAASTTQDRAGLISGLWCYLFGGGTRPRYRSASDGGVSAPAVSRCWWSFQDRPQYKTPPVPTEPGPERSEPEPDQGPSECGDGVPVIGRGGEIHIYPAE